MTFIAFATFETHEPIKLYTDGTDIQAKCKNVERWFTLWKHDKTGAIHHAIKSMIDQELHTDETPQIQVI